MRSILPVTVVVGLIAVAGVHGQMPSVTASAPADPVLLTGQVVDGVSSAPVGSVVVALEGSSGSGGNGRNLPRVLTDSRGRFYFSGVAAGTYTLTATKPGWPAGRRRWPVAWRAAAALEPRPPVAIARRRRG